MPIYEYECPTHGRYEVQQRITESSLTTCTSPGCGKPIRKLISSTSFALKGGGWYADGYSGSSNKTTSSADSSSSPSSSSSSSES